MRLAGIQGVLLDVEGTTSAVAYVYEVMFPFAAQHLPQYVQTHWGSPAIQQAVEQLNSAEPLPSINAAAVVERCQDLASRDGKATGLKTLQGLVWEAGFRSGELVAHVFDDVAPALQVWRHAGVDLRIYSSGSTHAQRLFFGHSQAGDLLPLFTGHYDTQIGSKREVRSYLNLATDWGLAPETIVALNDVAAELDAARVAGLQTLLVNRPGNAPVPDNCSHPIIERFDQLSFA